MFVFKSFILSYHILFLLFSPWDLIQLEWNDFLCYGGSLYFVISSNFNLFGGQKYYFPLWISEIKYHLKKNKTIFSWIVVITSLLYCCQMHLPITTKFEQNSYLRQKRKMLWECSFDLKMRKNFKQFYNATNFNQRNIPLI